MIDGPVCLPQALWGEIQSLHAHPPRHYHTLDHVVQVAETFRGVPHWQQPKEVFIAILFHDAIYEVTRTDNELRSAEVARASIRAWHLEVDPDRVSQLIALTAKHGRLAPEDVDEDTALFLDCDMAILGANRASYDIYEAGIAAEYRPVYGEGYKAGRRAFLEKLLARPLYLSDWFRSRLEDRARANLTRSLNRHGPDGSP
jgi:predicted metal-dependent HD superfamily phosphohydrolase